ncbi:MAG: sugar transferase, partial [Lachnospiraceae bacterium]|nr:sugar transferase [Lachnospiraceae bacterium]
GITGWAQVHGRRTVEWHDRIRMNNWYADHVSFFLDLRIFFMTIFKVIENKDNENIGETVKKEK